MNISTAYEMELSRIENAIGELEENASAGQIDAGTTTRLLYHRFHRASLTGNPLEFPAVEAAIDRAIDQIGPWADLCYLKANLDFKLHRLSSTKRDLEMAECLVDSPQAKVLRADIDFQEGRYQEAKKGYEAAIENNPAWDAIARLAHFEAKMGDDTAADRLYQEAEDEITAKEMRSYAWVELQRGLLDLNRGRYEEAWIHYRRANNAYSGYWLVEEHIAELLGAEGDFAGAITRYKEIVGRVCKPELQQAIGELYTLMDKSDEAEPWFEQALLAYLKSVERGEVHYYHHLADFYADVRQDGEEAVKWAQRDFELRQNFATESALAWACYCDGRFDAALDLINRALSSGVRDARLLHGAALIQQACGRAEESECLLKQAIEINPRYESFHVHH